MASNSYAERMARLVQARDAYQGKSGAERRALQQAVDRLRLSRRA